MEISSPLLRIKPNAMYKIGKYLRKENFTRIALFYGEGLKSLFDEQLRISFDSSEIKVKFEEVVYSNAVEDIFKSAFNLPPAIDAIVAIGGGKVIDYCKYIAFILQLPIISVPTSISNDGFASPGASLLVNGRRKSQKAKIPFGVVIDTDIIRKSPVRYTYSGIGDLISKYTAIYDWKLAYHMVQEPVNDFAVLISRNAVEVMVSHSNKDIKDLEFLRLICGCLVIGGVAMEVCGSSRPASGSEHLICAWYQRKAHPARNPGWCCHPGNQLFQNNPEHHLIKSVLKNWFMILYQKSLNKQILSMQSAGPKCEGELLHHSFR